MKIPMQQVFFVTAAKVRAILADFVKNFDL